MATSDVTALQHSDLNEFLFADVGTEASGMMLSVVSLFARQGSDPWREADRLAKLPKAVATDSLARTITAMPQGRWNPPDATEIAARLIGLLPARPARVPRRPRAGVAAWLPALPSTRSAIVLAGIALALAYAASTMLHPSPTPLDGGDVTSFVTPTPGQMPATGGPSSR